MSRETALPEYYVMLCARRYAEMAKKPVGAIREDELTQTRNRLTYILESGLIEFMADMFEGWAQGDRMDCVHVAMYHGYSDSLRSLVEAVGADFVPPPAPPGTPVSLIKFMALKLRQ